MLRTDRPTFPRALLTAAVLAASLQLTGCEQAQAFITAEDVEFRKIELTIPPRAPPKPVVEETSRIHPVLADNQRDPFLTVEEYLARTREPEIDARDIPQPPRPVKTAAQIAKELEVSLAGSVPFVITGESGNHVKIGGEVLAEGATYKGLRITAVTPDGVDLRDPRTGRNYNVPFGVQTADVWR